MSDKTLDQHLREFSMTHGVSPEVFQAALLVARDAPDPRAERVHLALAHLDSGELDARKLATALISSIIADNLP